MAKPNREELLAATGAFAYRAADGLEQLLGTIRESDGFAREAWSTWQKCWPLDGINIHAMKLLPRALARVRELGLDGAHLRKHHGIAKYLWLKGQVNAEGARAAAEKLKKQSIETIAIKGLAMRELGLVTAVERPMLDADLVLRDGNEMPAARRVLLEWGWREGSALSHATTFMKGNAELDLHRTCVRQDRYFNAFEWPLRARLESDFQVMDPTALMIVTCLHGMCQGSGLLWVLDSDRLAASGLVNWEAVVYFAKSRALTLTLCSALSRVHGFPVEHLQALERYPASHIEALELRHRAVPGDRTGSRAAAFLERLRESHEIVEPARLVAHESEPGLRWDSRWTKEWSGA